MLQEIPSFKSAMRHQGRDPVPFHQHETAELVLVLRGRVQIHLKEVRLEGSPGSLFILPAKVPHSQETTIPWKTICVLFQPSKTQWDVSPRVVEVQREASLRRWFEDLCDLSAQSPGIEDDWVCRGLFGAILAGLIRLENNRRAEQAMHPRLAGALTFIHEHFTEEIDAENLAASVGISYSHLAALFRGQFGMGPLQYQGKIRMDQACRLLADPYLSIREIARKCGYEDENYFARHFHKIKGAPPGLWRKNHGRLPSHSKKATQKTDLSLLN